MTREMKNSGVEWIGDIPREWKIRKIKNVCSIYTGNSIKDNEKNNFTDSTNAIPYIATKEIDVSSSKINYNNGMYIKRDDENFKVAPKKSTIMCIEGGSAGKKIAYLNQDVCFVNKLCCFSAKSLDDKFLYYYLKSPSFNSEFELHISGLIGGVSQGELREFAIPVPPLPEQERIADFLDSKVTEIDKIISETKASIENYKEYKQSVITEAVTKGLDKNVPMKETDSEWIGQIPSHWKYTRIQDLYELIDIRNTDPNALLLSLYTAIGVRPRNELEEKGNKAITVIDYKKVQKNDVIVNKLLAWMVAIGYSDYEGVTSPDYDVYRSKENANVVRGYYDNYFRHTLFKNDCYKYGHGIMLMRWRTYPEELLRIKVPNPPYQEQISISKYLNNKCMEIDKLILEKDKLITNLEEYKKSLIYEYVTGKKDVLMSKKNNTIIAAPIYPAVYNAKKSRFAQAVLMSKILATSNNNKGRVKLEKTLYMIEQHIGFNFETEYTREAAGPFDKSLYSCEAIISKNNKWFNINSSNYGVSYKTTKDVDKYKKYYNDYFANYNTEIERIIAIFDNFDTDQAEIIATLYGAWNDFLIDKKTFTDDDIVNDILNNWHKSKRRFSKDVWLRAMDKMRTLNLVPKGYGKKTVIKEV